MTEQLLEHQGSSRTRLLKMRDMEKKRFLKRSFTIVLILFAVMNVIASFHAYKFTHYTTEKSEKTKDASLLTSIEKIKTLFFGVDNPRPENKITPSQKFVAIDLLSNKKTACWWIKNESASGTVILFHGYGGNKASLIDKSDEFLKAGFNTLLVDFMGSGGSEGNQTTIGYYEAEEVITCYEFIQQTGEENIILFGTSMGAVAILRSISKYKITPGSIILECPYGTMYQTVCNRFKLLGVPAFPMAGLLTFWGGIQNGFWAFGMQPCEFAESVHCPTLLLYGAKDRKVTRHEIDMIYENLSGEKKLKIYADAGHDDYLTRHRVDWIMDINSFLKN